MAKTAKGSTIGVRVRKGVPVKTYAAGAISTRTAEFLLQSIIESPLGNDLIPSYIANLVIAIESTINDAFIDFLHKKMGADYKRHYKTFLWLRFKEKVSLLVLLASDFRYELDTDYHDLKSVLSLVELRNRMLHVKQHWFSATVTETQDGIYTEFENENDRDLYSDPKFEGITISDLKEYDRLRRRFVVAFNALGGGFGFPSRFQRKNFKPKGWFKKVGALRKS